MGARISKDEFDAARLELLRESLARLGLVVGILLLLLTALQAWVAFGVLGMAPTRPAMIRIGAGALAAAAFIVMPRLRRGRFAKHTLSQLTRRTTLLVFVGAFGQVPGADILAQGLNEALRQGGFHGTVGPAIPIAIILFCLHVSASLAVPWTTLEACVPAVGLAAASLVISTGASEDAKALRLSNVLLLLAAGAPGVAICAFRSRGLRELLGLRMIGERYAEVERELGTARRIHERLFPAEVTQGPLRMSYHYGPMRELGGDYLDAVVRADGSMTLTLVDVTGHGVAAALAVNRLHGEIRRTMAQHADATPTCIVEALNEYIHLTLASEQVFATAISIRVDARGAMALCIAGHPPAFMRRANGLVEQLDSTTPALGMLPSDALAAMETRCMLGPGDTLLLYTDGAIEIWNRAREQLGVEGLRRVVESARVRPGDVRGLVEVVVRSVQEFRAGPADDDTLVVAVALGDRRD